ncbi:MAG: hypothetical protein AB1486_31845 [Planctomycetota bacterium]
MRSAPSRLLVILVAAILVAWLHGRAGTNPTSTSLDQPIVFVRLPASAPVTQAAARAGGMLRSEYGPDCQLMRLETDGRLRRLSEGFAAACDPDVSFDGTHILFAGKRSDKDPWNIFEMRADGSDVRQVTRDAGNCRSPIYLPTLYMIVATTPWAQIAFVSDLGGEMNEYGAGVATDIYACKTDGSEVRRLTYNISDDFDPLAMTDGRVIFSCWQRMDVRRGLAGQIALFGVNTEGTDFALYSPNGKARIRHMACETRDRLVVFIEADGVGWDGAGSLMAVPMRRPTSAAQLLAPSSGGLFHSPAPLPDGSLLVAWRPADGSRPHAIYRLDTRHGDSTPVLDEADYHDFHARVIAPRSRPDGRSSAVDDKIATGKLYCLDVKHTTPNLEPHVSRELVRRIRLVEGVPVRISDDISYLDSSEHFGQAGPGSTENGIPPLVRRRLLGLVPIEEDGSIHVELPANIPIQLQALDEDGMALFSCGWIWVKNREWRGCIGCHEDPELVPENKFAMALRKSAVNLVLPPDRRRTVDFQHNVMPIVAAKCSGCHDGSKNSVVLTGEPVGPFNRAYVTLLEASDAACGDTSPAGRWLRPGEARVSPLVWRLFGRNTARPWDRAHAPDQVFPPHPPAGASPLTEREKLTFIEWIDLGALWNAVAAADGVASSSGGPGKEETR